MRKFWVIWSEKLSGIFELAETLRHHRLMKQIIFNMRLFVLLVLLSSNIQVFGQEGEVYWKVKRHSSVAENAGYKLRYFQGNLDFNTLKVLDFSLSKDSSFIGAWIFPETPNQSKFSQFFNGSLPQVDNISIEQYFSLNDTIFLEIYQLKSDSLWVVENRQNNNGLYFLKEYYQNKPILQPYMFNPDMLAPIKIDYFYVIAAEDSSLIQCRKTYSFTFNCENMYETLSRLQNDATKTLLDEIKKLGETKDDKNKSMSIKYAISESSNFSRKFADGLTKNIENYIDDHEAIVMIMSNKLKYTDAQTSLQNNIYKKHHYKTKDVNTFGWYKIPTSATSDIVVRLFEKNGKTFVAIIHDISITVTETTKTIEGKGSLRFTPLANSDIYNIQHYIVSNKNNTLTIFISGQSSNHDKYRPSYDEWFCDIFFGEPIYTDNQNYPWK